MICARCKRPIICIPYTSRMRRGELVITHAICPRRMHKRGTKKARKLSRFARRGDRALTAARRPAFKDPMSYVKRDGSEVLHGDDWMDRTVEVMARDLFVCQGFRFLEKHEPHVVLVGDIHHIHARGNGSRNDLADNLAVVCRDAHRELDRRKMKFSRRGDGTRN